MVTVTIRERIVQHGGAQGPYSGCRQVGGCIMYGIISLSIFLHMNCVKVL
jgi:hypothetical protein